MSTERRHDSLSLALLLIAMILLVGSVLVMIGWQIGNRTLIQIAPGFAPMQFNTALGFFGIGLSALGALRRNQRLLVVGAAGTGLLGGISLLQYLLAINVGLDELFTSGYVMDRTSHAGRMSEPTASGFFLCGLGYALTALASGRGQNWRLPVLLCACLAAIVTFASLLGYLTGFRTIGGWLNLYGMAVHTCAGFVLGTVALFLAEERLLAPDDSATALPAKTLLISVLIGGLALSMFAAGMATQAQDRVDEQAAQAELQQIATRLRESLFTSDALLDGTAGLYRASSFVDRSEWARYVSSLKQAGRRVNFVAAGVARHVLPAARASYEQSLREEGFMEAMIYPSRNAPFQAPVHYVEPLGLVQRELIGFDLAADSERAQLLRRSAADGRTVLTGVHPTDYLQADSGELAVSLIRALYRNDARLRTQEEREQALLGWAFLVLQPHKLMEMALAEVGSSLLVRLTDQSGSDRPLYQDLNFDAAAEQWRAVIEYGGRRWQLQAYHDESAAVQVQLTPVLVFVAGSGVTAAGCLLVLFLSFSQQRAKQLALQMTTSLRESEQQLRQNEEHYTLALRGSRDGYWDWNPHSGKLFCSPGLRSMLGAEEPGSGVRLDDYLATHCAASEEARLRPAIEGLLNADTDTLQLELEMTDAHGDLRWFQLRGRRLGGGRQTSGTRLAGSISNIHDRKVLELEMQERNVYLSNLNNELNQVSYVAAHNLREPVRKVAIFADRLRAAIAGNEAVLEQALKPLQRLDSNATKMANLVDDLLLYSQVVGGELQFGTCDFDELFRPSLAELARRFDPETYCISIDAIPEMRADRGLLRRAFEELFSNAILYRKPDEQALIRVVYVGLVPKAGSGQLFHRIEVRDNGIGIEQQFVERIFNLFEQLRPGSESGTGLGLAVARKVIERHGGYMGLTSEPGQGTTVWIELPEAMKI